MPRADLADPLAKVRSVLFLLLPDFKLAEYRKLKPISANERTNRCENAKADAALTQQVNCALWEGTVIRLIDYYDIVVYAQGGREETSQLFSFILTTGIVCHTRACNSENWF